MDQNDGGEKKKGEKALPQDGNHLQNYIIGEVMIVNRLRHLCMCMWRV